MKIGLSSYSMDNYMQSGEMTILDVMTFAKEQGAEHIELVPFGFTLVDDQTGVFDEALIAAAHSRWINNGSIAKCQGEFTASLADDILRKNFCVK